jgi:hypothetical protein
VGGVSLVERVEGSWTRAWGCEAKKRDETKRRVVQG